MSPYFIAAYISANLINPQIKLSPCFL